MKSDLLSKNHTLFLSLNKSCVILIFCLFFVCVNNNNNLKQNNLTSPLIIQDYFEANNIYNNNNNEIHIHNSFHFNTAAAESSTAENSAYFSKDIQSRNSQGFYYNDNLNSTSLIESQIKDNTGNCNYTNATHRINFYNNNDNNFSFSLSSNYMTNYIVEEKFIELYLKLRGLCEFETYEEVHACVELIEAIASFFREHTNWELLYNNIFNDTDCYNQFFNLTNNNYRTFWEILGASGKDLQDFGLEESCFSYNHQYFLINIEVNNTDIINNKNFAFFYDFLQLNTFNIGICFIKNCTTFVNNFFNSTLNPKFYSYLYNNAGVKKLEITDRVEKKDYSNLFLAEISVISFYLVFKIICTFFYFFTRIERKNLPSRVLDEDKDKFILQQEHREIYNNTYNKENNNNDDNKNNIDYAEKSMFTDRYVDLNYLNESEENFTDKYLKDNSYNGIYMTRMQRVVSFLYEFFSYDRSFVHLTEIKSFYYNDTALEKISYLKLILLFLHTFNHVFYTSIILPHRDFFNLDVFSSATLGLFKITCIALDCFVAVEALTMTFKLMSYIKRHGADLSTFFRFYLFSIPKIFLFLFIYFIFQLQFSNYGIIFGDNFIFNKILIEKFRMKECFSEDYFLIFNFSYFCYGDSDSLAFSKCFKFAYVYINMFLSFSICLLVLYFSFKIKSKKYDLTISFLVLVCFLVSFLNFDWDDIDKYNITLVLGELLSFKYLHLYFIKYFIGFLAGFFYFYSKEIVLTDSFINGINYLPFEFMFKYYAFLKIQKIKNKSTILSPNNAHVINYDNKSSSKISKADKQKITTLYSGGNYNNNNNISALAGSFISGSNEQKSKKISKNENYRKIIFICLSAFTIVFLCFYYITKRLIIGKKNEVLSFSWDLKILFFYERNLCVLAFIIFITGIHVTKSSNLFTAMRNSKLFLLCGRINLAYFCVLDSVIYLFFTVYDIEFYFSYQNVFFMTCGVSSIIFLISFVLVYLFELPVRKMVRKLNYR